METEMAPPGPGRPELADDQKRKGRSMVRVTDAEWAKIEAAASAAGMPTARWIRERVLDAADNGSSDAAAQVHALELALAKAVAEVDAWRVQAQQAMEETVRLRAKASR